MILSPKERIAWHMILWGAAALIALWLGLLLWMKG